jgi:hypothetical protein
MAEGENIHPSKVGSSGSGVPSNQEATGSPGPTPGTAEGDRETVEEDLRNKEQQDAGNQKSGNQ